MAARRISIRIDARLLRDVDFWVREGRYPDRARAIQAALREKSARWRRTRLAEALAKVDPKEEQRMADETFPGDLW